MRWWLASLTFVAIIGAGVFWKLAQDDAPDQERQQVSVLIDWYPEPTYLGVYFANDLGLYASQGLNVRFANVQGANRAISTLRAGGFHLATASGAATALSYNDGDDIVSVGVLYPRVATAVYALSSSGIRTPADLMGKRVGIYPGSINNQEFAAFLDRHNIDRRSVEVVALSGSDVALILEGRIDAAVNYLELSPQLLRTQLAAQGRTDSVWSMRLSDSVNLGYGLNLVTTRNMADSDSDAVANLAEAIYEGYRRGCARPEEAVDAFLGRFPEFERDYVQKSWQIVCEQLANPLGQQSVEGWQATVGAVQRFGLLQRPIEAPARLIWSPSRS